MATYKFDEGVMWEDNPWTIETDYKCSEYGGTPCRHCYDEGSTYLERTWICPRVVIAKNEAGYNSTGVCLDCILEAVEEINKAEKE